jgi:cobyrinic acid a,c-diamide synthase
MSRLFISAARKSSGKTSISIGLCAALSQRGLSVQPFKKGPDYIDPHWLALASARPCYNLDFYTMERDEILLMFASRSVGADISLIEGNKGLYDGLDLDGSNSNAALAELLDTPVVLVLDARGMTRGIAPLILGYQAFDRNIDIRGVILNRLGGFRHESKLRNVIEHYTDVKVIGAVHNDARLNIDERHLGLVPGHEDNAALAKIEQLCEAVQEQVDLDALIDIAGDASPLPASTLPEIPLVEPANKADVRIGIVKSAAFGFYYPDDLEALEQAGATLVDIDNLKDTELADVDGLFIGGGFPETHMQALEANQSFRQQLRSSIDNGLPVYAECGGLMYLARSITWKNECHDMVGAIDGDIVMEDRPQGRGYAQLQENPLSLWPSPDDNVLLCHEFHYSRFIHLDKRARFAFKVLRGTGIDGVNDGYIRNNMLACYIHQRNTRNNHWAQRFVAFVRQTRKLNT